MASDNDIINDKRSHKTNVYVSGCAYIAWPFRLESRCAL